jgi:hypothetical protein
MIEGVLKKIILVEVDDEEVGFRQIVILIIQVLLKR